MGAPLRALGANAPWYNTTLAFAMLVGRFAMIIPIMARLGGIRWRARSRCPESAGTFPVSGPLFTLLLMGTVLIVGALNFFPALTLGPVVEHFLMHTGQAVLVVTFTSISTHMAAKTHSIFDPAIIVPAIRANRSKNSIRVTWSETR